MKHRPGTAKGHCVALHGAAHWLSLAAAPTFTTMAVLSLLMDDGRSDLICSASRGPAWLLGMAPMYMLMGVFHLAPWLRSITGRHGRPQGSIADE
ncbi:membrane protein [soil metagenome]